MSTTAATDSEAADTAAGSSAVLHESDTTGSKSMTMPRIEEGEGIPATTTTTAAEETNANTTSIATTTVTTDTTGENITLLRVVRLEQNRKAASESRKRKRILLDELQRSVIFFTRANDTLKQQNHTLQKLLQQAQSQIKIMDQKTDAKTNDETTNPSEESNNDNNNDDDKEKVHLPIVLPPAHAIPQISNFLNTVETGATIQAMTNFQQAASAAMKAALLHMQQQYNNNNNDGTDQNSNGIQQHHQSLFEIATLTLPTAPTTTKAMAAEVKPTDASTSDEKNQP